LPSSTAVRTALAAALALALLSGAADAKVYYSQQEALELAFPDADRVEKDNHLLDDAQVEAIQGLAKAPIGSRLVSVYTGYRKGEVLGYALIDIHTVRTQPEAFLILVSPEGIVRSLRVLAFYEPEEYLPTDRWLHQFDRKMLTESLALHGEIHGIAGATLSARAVTSGVRRALALYEVLLRQQVADSPETGTDSGL